MSSAPSSLGTPQVISIDLGVFDLDTVTKACYKFTGRAFIKIDRTSSQTAEVTIQTKRADENVEILLGEFHNELLDQRLRATVAAETSGIRDLIMAHALSRTDLVRAANTAETPTETK